MAETTVIVTLAKATYLFLIIYLPRIWQISRYDIHYRTLEWICSHYSFKSCDNDDGVFNNIY